MKKKLTKDFTTGNIPKQMLWFTLPFMASNALQVLYSTIDMMIVGQYVGTAGLSAVAQSSQIVNFATMVFLGFANAGQVLISQALGAGKKDKINNITGTLTSLLFIIALAFLAIVRILSSFNCISAAASSKLTYRLKHPSSFHFSMITFSFSMIFSLSKYKVFLRWP